MFCKIFIIHNDVATVSAQIGDEKIYINAIWVDKKFNPESDFPFILGREGIFNRFDITFEGDERIIFRKRDRR